MYFFFFRYEGVTPGSTLFIHVKNFQIRAESNQSIKFLVTPVDFTSNWSNILAEKVLIEYLLVESIKVEWTLIITASDFCDLTPQSDNSGGLLALELNFDCKICSADGADISQLHRTSQKLQNNLSRESQTTNEEPDRRTKNIKRTLEAENATPQQQ